MLALSTPAQAVVPCTGHSSISSAVAGTGANCGFLGVGDTFELDVTSYFAGLGNSTFNATRFGAGIVTSGGSAVTFSNVKLIATGTVTGGYTFTNVTGAVWGSPTPATPPSVGVAAPPFGSATESNFSYAASDAPSAPFNGYSQVTFAFGDIGLGGFGSWKESPNEYSLASISKFIISGQLTSVEDVLRPM